MNAKIRKELQRISNSIPEYLKKNIIKKQAAYPTLVKIVDKALKDKDVNPELKNKLKLIKASGMLKAKEEVENTKITKQIDKYLDEQIQRSIRLGRLPKHDNNYNKKIEKYVRKNNPKNNQKKS